MSLDKLIEQAKEEIADPDNCPSPGHFAYGKQIVPKVAEYNMPYYYVGSVITYTLSCTLAIVAGWPGYTLLFPILPACLFVMWFFCTQAFAEGMGPMAFIDYVREFYKYFKMRKSGTHYILHLRGGSCDVAFSEGLDTQDGEDN